MLLGDDLDGRADVWMAGVMALENLTGANPFLPSLDLENAAGVLPAHLAMIQLYQHWSAARWSGIVPYDFDEIEALPLPMQRMELATLMPALAPLIMACNEEGLAGLMARLPDFDTCWAAVERQDPEVHAVLDRVLAVRPAARIADYACAAALPALTEAQSQRLREALKDMPRLPEMDQAVQEMKQLCQVGTTVEVSS
jgi:hypothetical protein